MFAEALRRLYEYNSWATEKLLETAEGLSQEQLHAPGQAGRGSIRDTLLHLVNVHKGWLSWWDGTLSGMDAYNMKLDPAEYPDVGALRREWATVVQQTQAFIAGLRDDDPERLYGIDLPDGQHWDQALWKMMLHVANHGTQHRAETASMMTAFGHSPGDLDLLFYLDPPVDAPKA